METQGRASIRFTLNGHHHELARQDVESRLADVAPDAIRKHAVMVNGTWFPVIQAFEAATGPRDRSSCPTQPAGTSRRWGTK